MRAAAAPAPVRSWFAATAGAFVVLLAWQRIFHFAPIDDAYIFLRYARNWAAGLGPVFNPGERVEGYSSPLWLVILTAGQIAAPGSTALSMLAGALCASMTIGTVVAEALRRGVSPVLAWCAGGFMVTNPGMVYWSFSGMDTALFSLLACAAMLRLCIDVERGRLTMGTAVLLSAACLARMEGFLLLAVAAGFSGARWRSVRWQWLILVVMVCGLWLVARKLYYGEWLPNTYYAKVAGHRSLVWANGARYCGSLAGTHGALLIGLAIGLALSFRTGVFPALLPCVALVLLWPAYVLWTGGDHFAMGRLIQPLMPILLSMGLLALEGLRRSRTGRWPLVLCLAILALASTSVVEWKREGPRAYSEMAAGTRWSELGTWLGHRAPADAWIAAVPIGGIAWGSDRPVLDLTGLTNPTIAKHGAVDPEGLPGHLKFHSEYVLARAPAVVFLNFGGSEPGRFPLFRGYNMALRDLLSRARTASMYRLEVHPVAPRRFAHFLVRRDVPSLSDR